MLGKSLDPAAGAAGPVEVQLSARCRGLRPRLARLPMVSLETQQMNDAKAKYDAKVFSEIMADKPEKRNVPSLYVLNEQGLLNGHGSERILLQDAIRRKLDQGQNVTIALVPLSQLPPVGQDTLEENDALNAVQSDLDPLADEIDVSSAADTTEEEAEALQSLEQMLNRLDIGVVKGVEGIFQSLDDLTHGSV